MKQKKILFYVHDGTGYGHLRRLSLIAESLQGICATLIVSGHRSMSWIVPNTCEFIHLPSLDSMLNERSKYWNQKTFWDITKKEVIQFRKNMLKHIVSEFSPDVIFMDYYPTGILGEMSEIILQHKSIKYFVLRGVIDEIENYNDPDFPLNYSNQELIENCFSKVFVTCDSQIYQIENQFQLSSIVRSKLYYVGFATKFIDNETIENIRYNRGLKKEDIWIVISAGGGKHGEKLIENCLKLPELYPDFKFDIIHGFKSSKKWEYIGQDFFYNKNLIYHRSSNNLPSLQASADIVICHGGYNSIVESIVGNSYIITIPNSGDQFINPKLMSRFHSISYSENIDNLPNLINNAITDKYRKYGKVNLNLNGIENIKSIVFNDLGIEK